MRKGLTLLLALVLAAACWAAEAPPERTAG